jgi:uncharacterized protein
MLRFLRRVAIAISVLVAIAAVAVVALTMLEPRLIFHPSRGHEASPEDLGLTFEELLLSSSDGVTVHGYHFVPAAGEQARAHLLYSHGNAGNVSTAFYLAQQLVERGFGVLMYDYRGYGHSSDVFPTETGVYADGEAALAALVERAGGPERVVLYGHSLGGGVSYELAARHPEVAGIVTDAAFTSVPDMVRHMPLLAPFASLVRTRMDNLRRIAQVRMPKLIFHGTADETVPFSMAEELRDRARPPVELVAIAGAGHNDAYLQDRELYFGTLSRFVDRCAPPRPR